MISKDSFCEIINFIKEMRDSEDRINKFLNKELGDFSCFLYSKYEDKVVELLDDIFETDFVSYFIYELNFGRNYECGNVVGENGENIDISTPEMLYDFLITRKSDK